MTNRTCPICSLPIANTKLERENRKFNCTELCAKCFEEAGLENEHMDGHHDNEPNELCPDCNDVPAAELPTTRKHQLHTECYANDVHAKTPAGRAACRKTRTN